MRRAFTLLELVTIVAIIGIMATVGVMGLNSGKGAARMKGAARDIFATVRHARSTALVTQQPAIITYSEKKVDDEICASVEITATRMMNNSGPSVAETISGEKVNLDDGGGDAVPAVGEESALASGGGLSSEDFFFAPISEDVVKGIRISVTKGDERVESSSSRDETYRPAISVFSNVDYLLGKFKDAKKSADEAANDSDSSASSTTASSSSSSSAPLSSAELQEAVSIVWEVNGRCEPHTVWIYREGQQPDSGLCIKVDRFGGAKIVSADEI